MSPCLKAHGIYNFGEPSLVYLYSSCLKYAYNVWVNTMFKESIFYCMTNEWSTKPVYLMTPGTGFLVQGRGRINHIVIIHYFVLKSSSKLLNIVYSDWLILSEGLSTKSVNFMNLWYMYEGYHMYNFDDVYQYTTHWLLLYLGVTSQFSLDYWWFLFNRWWVFW